MTAPAPASAFKPNRFRQLILAGGIVLTALQSIGTSPAQQTKPAPTTNGNVPLKPKTPGNDWIQFFNEKDLTGRSAVGAESWTVEADGILHGKGLTKAYGYLQTDMNYKDFQMSLRFKCVGDGNSGVFFHTGFKGVDATQGLQFEIDCAMMNHTAGVYAEDGRGWLVWPSPENEGVVRKGEWNDYLIEIVGNRYRSRLNGVPMVHFTDPKPGATDGTMALQLHAGVRATCSLRTSGSAISPSDNISHPCYEKSRGSTCSKNRPETNLYMLRTGKSPSYGVRAWV